MRISCAMCSAGIQRQNLHLHILQDRISKLLKSLDHFELIARLDVFEFRDPHRIRVHKVRRGRRIFGLYDNLRCAVDEDHVRRTRGRGGWKRRGGWVRVSLPAACAQDKQKYQTELDESGFSFHIISAVMGSHNVIYLSV